MFFHRKKALTEEQVIELQKTEKLQEQSEVELETAKTLSAKIREIREANHFAEQFAKVLGGENA